MDENVHFSGFCRTVCKLSKIAVRLAVDNMGVRRASPVTAVCWSFRLKITQQGLAHVVPPSLLIHQNGFGTSVSLNQARLIPAMMSP